MATLGQQVQARQEAQQQGRATRIERLKQQRSEQKFEALKSTAKKVQEEQFKEKVIQEEETYYDYRPKSYSEFAWNRLSQKQKDNILREYQDKKGFEYHADRGTLIRIPQTRTTTRTVPFTLDEGENTYEQAYSNLSPELKQFFISPETLKAERTQRIQSNITQVDQRLSMAQARIRELDAKYERDKQKIQETWESKSDSYRRNQKNRERLDKDFKNLENNYNENKAEQGGLIAGLSQGRTQLASAKDIDFNAIISYADDLSTFYENKETARQDRRQAQKEAIKNLEQRNKEAQASGFDFSGIVNESFKDPSGRTSPKGTKYFLSGAQVDSSTFGKKFDVYNKPKGGTLILSKGTDLSKLSDKQLEAYFPREYAESKTIEAQRLRAFASNVESLPVTEQTAPSVSQKSIFRRILDPVSDVLSGLFLKSTAGLGIRGFASGEPTGFTGMELAEKREEALDKATLLGITRGELVRDQAPSNKSFSIFSNSLFGIGKFPSLLDFSGTQIEGIKLSRDIRESGEITIAQQELDTKEIEKSVTRFTDLNTKTEDIQQRFDSGDLSSDKAKTEFSSIEQERFSIFEDLASKGIKTNIDVDSEGMQKIAFTSKALETDLDPASVKLLRMATPSQKALLISSGFGAEVLQSGSLGLLTGGTGTSAYIGKWLTKTGTFLKPLVSASPFFPLATKAGLLTAFGVAFAGKIGYTGYKGIARGERAGIGKVGGFALGAGIPLTQAVAFAGGSYIGNKIYTENILARLERGEFTRTIIESKKINGKIYKIPASKRIGKAEFNEQGEFAKVAQSDKLRTKVPGTDIIIDTDAKLKGAFVGNKGGSLGSSVSTVKGSQAGALSGQKNASRALYFDKEGQTAIVTFTKTPKGIRVDQFISSKKANDFKILTEGADGSKTVFIDFNRYSSKIGTPIYVKGGTLSDASIKATFNRFIGQDNLFSGFMDDIAPYSFGRTQQIIAISPKVAKGATYDLGAGSFKILSETNKVQSFASIGSVRSVRTDTLKNLINQITKREGGFSFVVKNLLANKKGQVALPSFTKPDTFTAPTTLNLPKGIGIPRSLISQDQFVGISPISDDLKTLIRSIIGSNTIIGSTVLFGSVELSKKGYGERINQRSLTLQLQKLNLSQLESSTSATRQQQQQTQQQQTLQQQIQQLQLQINVPSPTPTATPTPFTPSFAFGDFGSTLEDKVRAKAKKKKQGRDLAYVQDFTSKIVGFKPIKVSEKEAFNLARKVQTGFELRMPIIIRKDNKDTKRLKKLLAQ